MTFGIVCLFCPICGSKIIYNSKDYRMMHSKEWGFLCSRECYEKGELKYARMILGKDDFEPGWFKEVK